MLNDIFDCDDVGTVTGTVNKTLPLKIQLSRGDDWDAMNKFKPATFLCLFQARAWI
jgi:hypothetical protein